MRKAVLPQSSEINVTPMLDVLLVLLVTFMAAVVPFHPHRRRQSPSSVHGFMRRSADDRARGVTGTDVSCEPHAGGAGNVGGHAARRLHKGPDKRFRSRVVQA